MRILASLLFVAGLTPVSGLANSVTVGCAGGAGQYSSIGGALSALRAVSNRDHQITVTGVCTEFVDLSDFENVTLNGPSTASIDASINGPTNQGGGPTIRMRNSTGIVIRDLLVTGAIQGTNVTDAIQVTDSTLTLIHTVLEHGNNGLALSGNAHVVVGAQNTFQDNTSTGIRTDDTSSLVINANQAANKVVIQRNGMGVSAVGRSSVAINGVTEIRDNPYYGVYAQGGAITFGAGAGQTIVAGNGSGVAAAGGTVGQNGVALLIQNNTDTGVTSWHGGSITLMNAVIDGNGSLTARAPFDAAVLVDVTASLFLGNVVIRNSPVTALYVRDGASTVMSGTTITGNLADGIRVETLSGVRFQGSPTSVTGNGGTDLVCDADTYVVGAEFATIGRKRCGALKGRDVPAPRR